MKATYYSLTILAILFSMIITGCGGGSSSSDAIETSRVTELNPNTPAQGRLDGTSTGTYRFDALSGISYAFEITIDELTNAILKIYDPDGSSLLVSSSDTSANVQSSSNSTGSMLTLNWVCPESGKYYVTIEGEGSYLFAYSESDTDGDNYSISQGDCNDSDASIYPGAAEVCNGVDDDCDGLIDGGVATTFFADSDNDGYGDPDVTTQACSQPAGHVADSTDCDDTNAAINPAAPEVFDAADNNCNGRIDEDLATYYRDSDGDGYGDPTDTLMSAQGLPAGYSVNNTDCNDNNPAITPMTFWYKDADNDQYSDGTFQMQCERPASHKLTSELVSMADCDDTDPALNPVTVWYRDVDNDGYYDGTILIVCVRPTGYKSPDELVNAFALDCNDLDPIDIPDQVWYKDVDGDGYSDGTIDTQSCTRPAGYKIASELTATSGDCNDAELLEHPNQTWYKDTDNDGYSDGTSNTASCTRPADYKVASELAAIIGDCNDTDPLENPAQTWYKDSDDDGYSDGITDAISCVRPGGYKTASELTALSGDCSDDDATQYPGQTWYKDVDDDGHSDGTTQGPQCARPTGYARIEELSALSGDCDDDEPTIYRNAPELLDGLDNNCNAVVDTILTPEDYGGTIQTAINNADPGIVISVDDGTYYERINFAGKAVTLQSRNGAAVTTIDASGAGRVVSSLGTDSVLDGFTITNGYVDSGSGYQGGGIFCSGNASIRNCIITGNDTLYGQGFGGGIYVGATSSTITNCTISGNFSGNLGGGLYFVTGSAAVITNCLITGNTGRRFGGGVGALGGNPRIVNCTSNANSPSAMYLSSADATILNSIIWDRIDLWYADITVNYSTYNAVNNSYGSITGGDNAIGENPLWVGGGDYHLSDASPCIDAGVNDGAPYGLAVPTDDMDGEARPNNGTVDKGADEYYP